MNSDIPVAAEDLLDQSPRTALDSSSPGRTGAEASSSYTNNSSLRTPGRSFHHRTYHPTLGEYHLPA